MKTLIAIPTYNESENIIPLLESVLEKTPPQVEVLVVDDGSPDGTGERVEAFLKKNPRVHCLHRSAKLGLGTAYVAAFRWGFERGYDAFVEMDADFSHHPSYLSEMLTQLSQSEVVIGSRYVPGGGTRNWGWSRRLLSRAGSWYARMILGAPIRDFTGGFNGWRRSVLEAVGLDSLRSDGYSFQIELKYRAYVLGFRIQEFPIVFEDRKVGQSKMNRRIVFEALARIWGFRWSRSRVRLGA